MVELHKRHLFEFLKIIEGNFDMLDNFALSQNYPNPFNPVTTISYSLPQSGNVKLIVFNLLGERVAEFVNGFKEASIHRINFNASEWNSGIYIYKLEQNGQTESRKMMLVK
jgi:hypothetical protein